jgi:hypothetical protein
LVVKVPPSTGRMAPPNSGSEGAKASSAFRLTPFS